MLTDIFGKQVKVGNFLFAASSYNFDIAKVTKMTKKYIYLKPIDGGDVTLEKVPIDSKELKEIPFIIISEKDYTYAILSGRLHSGEGEGYV